MNAIQTHSPAAVNALEHAQEAKRKLDVEKQAVAKAENKLPTHQANQVFFSQAAQFRLNEEKSQEVKRVEEARIADQIKAAEQQSQALSQEKQKAVEARIESRAIGQDRDRAARAKTEVAVKAAVQNDKRAEAAAAAAHEITATGNAKALAAQKAVAKGFEAQASAAIATRTLNEHQKAGNAALEHVNRVAAQNSDELEKQSKVDIERVRTSRVNVEHKNAEVTKALNMYHKVSKI